MSLPRRILQSGLHLFNLSARHSQLMTLTQPIHPQFKSMLQQRITTQGGVTRDRISTKPLSGLGVKTPYQMGIAKKHLYFADHIALAFRQHDDDLATIIGRQSPSDKQEAAFANQPSVWSWLKQMTVGRRQTGLDNEADYKFFSGTAYTIDWVPSDLLTVTGGVIIASAEAANKTVCDNKPFDLVSSNCVTGATEFAMNILDQVMQEPGDADSRLKRELAMYEGIVIPLALANESQGVLTDNDLYQRFIALRDILTARDFSAVMQHTQGRRFE